MVGFFAIYDRITVMWVLSIIFSLLGGIISRAHGGGFAEYGEKYLNKQLKNALWSLPFGVIAWLCGGEPWICALAVALCWVGVTTGHGRFLGSDEPLRDDMKPEKLEYLILWLQKSLHERPYKHLGMAVTGLAAVSGGVIAFMTINPLAAIIIALGGLLKGVAYEIGTFILPNQTKSGIKNFMYKTEIGEFIRGLFAYGGLAVGFIIAQ